MNTNDLGGSQAIGNRASVILQKKKDSFKILKNRNPEDGKVLLLINTLINYPNDATLVLIDD